MKLINLPIKILQFWYPEAFIVFLRTFKHTILYLEEDLAVGLMFKLLFVPLFHDASIVGRVLSFCFRSFRILLGLFAFVLTSGLTAILAVIWFLLPVLAFIFTGLVGYIFKGLLFSGVVLFAHHILSHPAKGVWQIKDIKDIWQASWIKHKDNNLVKLLKTEAVKIFLSYLEKNIQDFANFPNTAAPDTVLTNVLDLGKKTKAKYLDAQYFFAAKILNTPDINNQLMKLDLTLSDLIDTLDFLVKRDNFWKVFFVWDEDFQIKHLKGVNRGWLGVPTQVLDSVSEDLTRKASKYYIEDFIGRPHIVAEVINLLSLEKGRNVLLVGEPGVGKSALVEYLAKLIIAGDAPDELAIKRLVKLDISGIMIGITSQGELAERLKIIFDEIRTCGDIVLFIDEIQNLGIGEAGSQFNLFSLMLPYIESSNFQFLATTEPGNYTKILEKNGSFARLFNKVNLPPATIAETVEILKVTSIEHERNKEIKTSILSLKAIPHLCNQYIHDRLLPDSALQVFNECLHLAEAGWINKRIVEEVLQRRVNIPIGEVTVQEEKQQLLNLEAIIHKRMIDQEQAVSAVANVLRRSATGIREKNRPIGSFLFVGPTGVGKTELAKILADVYFKTSGAFIRFDMSEYQLQESVDKLIGKPGEDGLLADAIRAKPYSLVLLDEFEKADPKLLTLFLQVLEDGRLTSGSGILIDFTNTIIIATSNAASLTIAHGLQSGQAIKQIDKAVNDELLQIFKPELINRFDDVILFRPLSEADLQKIVRIKLAALQNQLREQGYVVEFDEDLVLQLTQRGYDPVLGARPLRRLIQDTLEAKLSRLILEGKLQKGEKFIASEHPSGL